MTENQVPFANQKEADYAMRFHRRSQERYEVAVRRIRAKCIEGEKHPEALHARAVKYAEWLRERLHELHELPGCGHLHGDPALDMVSDYLWWLESEIRNVYEKPNPHAKPR